MKYYILKADERNPLPRVINWFEVINPDLVNSTHGHMLPRFTKLEIAHQEEMIFPDILTHPVFMVSKNAAQIIRYYDSSVEFKYATLMDFESKENHTYFLPLLDSINCLSDDSELSLDKSVIKKAIINKKRVNGKQLFLLAGIKSPYICARLDIIESLLRRNVVGMSLLAVGYKNDVQLV